MEASVRSTSASIQRITSIVRRRLAGAVRARLVSDGRPR
jgi:hypothetical protein